MGQRIRRHAGPTVTRSGFLMSTGGGITMALTRNVAVDVLVMYSIVGFRDAKVFGKKVQGSSSRTTFWGLKGGIAFLL